MPFSTLVYSASLANGTVLQALPSVVDAVYRQQGNGYIVDATLNKLGMASYVAVNGLRAQVQSPTLRQILNKEVRPIQKSMPTGLTTLKLDWFMDAPIPLGVNEELDFYEEHSTATAQVWGMVNLVDNPVQKVNGPYFSALFTGSTTLTANAWTLVPLTSDQQLPPGTYDVVGARCESSGLIAFRLVFTTQVFRPGGIGSQVPDAIEPPQQRKGNSGLWGSFPFNQIPYVECFSASGDTSELVYLDLIKH